MLFKYKGYDSNGLKVKAHIEASNLEEAKGKLKAKSILYTYLEEEQKFFLPQISFKRIKSINQVHLAHLRRPFRVLCQ